MHKIVIVELNYKSAPLWSCQLITTDFKYLVMMKDPYFQQTCFEGAPNLNILIFIIIFSSIDLFSGYYAKYLLACLLHELITYFEVSTTRLFVF